MVFNQKEDLGNVSEWNDGNYLMFRLHEIQTSINRLKLFPTEVDPTTKIPNYELLFRSINALFGEGAGKYSDEEINEILIKKDTIRKQMEAHPPIKFERKTLNGKQYISQDFNKDNFEKLIELIEHYEIRVKQINDKRGFSSRNVQDDGGL